MTPNKYFIVKLPENWLEREYMRGRLKFITEGLHLDEVEAVTYQAVQKIDEERYRGRAPKDFEDYLKNKMAVTLGEKLLSNGLFRIRKTRDHRETTLEGKLILIKEELEEGESDD